MIKKWHICFNNGKKATNIYVDNDKLNMVINGERIYILIIVKMGMPIMKMMN